MIFTTRFAPSPTGPLHLGHAYSAMLAFDLAKKNDGTMLLRIEDIDQSRARAHWETQIYDDLRWLGLTWPEPPMRQSARLAAYEQALDDLWSRGLLYPCSCTRKDIQNALEAPQEGVSQFGPDGLIYPGTCRRDASRAGMRPRDVTLRLDMAAACAEPVLFGRGPGVAPRTGPEAVGFRESGNSKLSTPGLVTVSAQDMVDTVGDIVVARCDINTSYHLAVVVDDASQSVSDVVRGEDLFEATKIHVVLQKLLAFPTPVYHHHHLIRDASGKRLAKRDDARAISKFRAEGCSLRDIRALVGL